MFPMVKRVNGDRTLNGSGGAPRAGGSPQLACGGDGHPERKGRLRPTPTGKTAGENRPLIQITRPRRKILGLLIGKTGVLKRPDTVVIPC
jgi:hypothetical protein